MNEHDIAEQAYKNGYEAGKRDAVKHGRWLKVKEPLGWRDVDCVECSCCKESWVIDEDYEFDDFGGWNYCPNCGARMDGDGNADSISNL